MFSAEDKVFIKVLRQGKSLQTKLVSVICEEVADD